jgi:hypothetical protein
MTLSAMSPEEIAETLRQALGATPSAASTRDGWILRDVKVRLLMGRDVPVVTLARDGATLSFIVSLTNPEERAYKRSKRFDIVYFSEDVPDDAQQEIYDTHRAIIDRFAAWLIAWDDGGGEPP